MKLKTYLLSAAAAGVTAVAILASTTGAVKAAPQQAPAQAPPAPGQAPGGRRPAPPPTNLQVLPKNLTGEQVHEIMHKWEDELGASCSTCHAPDPKNIGPNGRPRLNYVDDSKPEKATARKMVQMTEMINTQYIAKIESDGQPVTCGTCHRGHLGPQPFNPDADGDKDHDHSAPPKQ